VAVGERVDLWLNGSSGRLVTAPLGTNSVGDSVSGVPFNNATGTAVGARRPDGPGRGRVLGPVAEQPRGHGPGVGRPHGQRSTRPDLTNFNARGVVVVIDITAGGGAGSLTVKLTGKDTLSGSTSPCSRPGRLAAPGVSTYSFQVFPGSPTVAQVSATPATIGKADFLVPRLWRIEVTAADATSYTYSGRHQLPRVTGRHMASGTIVPARPGRTGLTPT
jgi:hypothetical protein